ncbi:MAG: Lrp/AsnC family transcriptional regulator [Desulfovibrionaceae bacterium]|nr:Lrp/AsnC family transcriptional regulator [Desulfovibrionaceae bacterium]
MGKTYSEFTQTERRILALAQKNLPDSATPYADIAVLAGSTEDEVLELLRSLKDAVVIRRFGASLKHQRAGYKHNLMVAWKVKDRQEADAAARAATALPQISHCYYRPSPEKDRWPWEFFTMFHGRREEDCAAGMAELSQKTGLTEYAALRSLRELKKISMTYF